ncbi:hypothetical protein [Pseudonocardia sp. WMMC193]|uniref:hypothetical protein n=1 Tax=Pseudonocardia sp. WMMC193 TaxID=2911965 RepID=UPI001F1A5017|nr:hypothetical protein [Pseudonocardia sp. WMMC193]MCF7551777.1 hypothetical protein [Pseudonocardia sp. WMMC193]
MTLQQSWTLDAETDPFARVRERRALTNAPRRTWPSGPTTWAESAARTRRRHRRARLSRWLTVLVLLAALAAAGVIWQLADGTPLVLLREARDQVEPAIESLRRLIRS